MVRPDPHLPPGFTAWLAPFLASFSRATSVKVVEKAGGLEVATDQAALGGSCRVSVAGGGLSISPIASTPM